MTPCTIVTGFLGSGKTKIIQNTIKHIWDKEKVAIIKNEISDVGVDALELSDPKLTVIELPNGCICCTLVGALNESINEVIEKYKLDRLIIEASGFAKPGQIVIGLDLIKNIKVDGVIVVIDALNYTQLKEIEKSNAARVQSEFVDLYILNKVDLVSENDIDLIKDDILGNFPNARIIETSDANIPPELILGLNPKYLSYELDLKKDHDYEDFEFFVLENLEIDQISHVQDKFEKLPKTIYRIKGYFSIDAKKYILNSVGGKVSIIEFGKNLPSKNKFVFIGKEIKKYEDKVKNFLTDK